MKVFVNDKVYVQKEDLACLIRRVNKEKIPLSIIERLDLESLSKPFIVSGEDKHEFVDFSSPFEISFFKRCDWIVDYHFFDGMSESEINAYRNSLIEQKNKIAKAYVDLSETQGEESFPKVINELGLLEYKIWSIWEIGLYKRGGLDFDIPGEKKENPFQRVLRKVKRRINKED